MLGGASGSLGIPKENAMTWPCSALSCHFLLSGIPAMAASSPLDGALVATHSDLAGLGPSRIFLFSIC